MININSLPVTSLKINAGVIKNSLGSLVVKTHGEGRGKREKVGTNVCHFIQICATSLSSLASGRENKMGSEKKYW